MRPLRLDDLLPLEEFAAQRRTLLDTHLRYLDRYRRVRVGPRVTLVFENRQTLWFRVQDILRIARLARPDLVQQELNLYNRLLPGPDHLQASLLLEVADEGRLGEQLAPWRDFKGDQLRLRLGGVAVPAHLVTCRPEDLVAGTAHWVQFALDDTARRRLGDFRKAAHFEMDLPAYQHAGEPLSDDLRQSLVDDLTLSDRD